MSLKGLHVTFGFAAKLYKHTNDFEHYYYVYIIIGMHSTSQVVSESQKYICERMCNGCMQSSNYSLWFTATIPYFLACLYLEHNLPVLKTITKQVHILEVKLDVCFLCLL